mmetsp:Transcript_50944/g.114423  ORF Transcript_50944/g.114423 Transcript_50944/m.114423 type:complete len:105 (-) Transcript_50944:457-771(-)
MSPSSVSMFISALDTRELDDGTLAAVQSHAKQNPLDVVPKSAKVSFQPNHEANTGPPPSASRPPIEPPVSTKEDAVERSLAGIHFESIAPVLGKEGPSSMPIKK